ncbi:MAG: hypothetical protein BIFFINMI_00633 [Phycisphaerae bacterium]|nr:hypothetical protein [Phycisphaerae bacterium]
MKTFTDTTGRTWDIVVNVDTIKRVRDLTKISLLEIVEPGNALVDRLASDVILVCDVLFAVVKPQADERKVSDTDFGRSLSGDVIDQATTALLEELIDFFPSRRRAILRQAWAKVLSVKTRLEDKAEQEARTILADPRLEDQLMAALSGGSSGNSPASSASAPGN